MDGEDAAEKGGDEVEEEPAVTDFMKWAGPRAGTNWRMLRDMCPVEQIGTLRRRGSIGIHLFVEQVKMLGFPGDARRVYEIISYDHATETCSESIELRQLLQFQNNYENFEDQGRYLADAFTEFLKKRHGVVVRAWRKELDKHNKGRITYKDLGCACKRLGFEMQNVKKLWAALKQLNPDTSHDPRSLQHLQLLKLEDIAEIEVLNIERFACIVWDELGNLDNAWQALDPHGANLVTFAHFEKGCDAIGFDGDRKMLFLGLDLSGCGRLLRPDLEFLRYWSPGTSSRSWTDEDLGIHFSRWLDVHFEGPEAFFGAIDDGQRKKLSEEEFIGAARAHGYTGSHKHLQRLFMNITHGKRYCECKSLARFTTEMQPLVSQSEASGSKIARRGMSRSASEHQLQQRSGTVEKTRDEILKLAKSVGDGNENVGWREIVSLVDLPRTGAETPRMSVAVFIRRLRKLAERSKEDLEIDPKALSSMLARADGDPGSVSKRDVLLLRKRLGDQRKFDPKLDFVAPPKPSEKWTETMNERASNKDAKWNQFVGDQGALNVHLSAVNRTYFSVAKKTRADRQMEKDENHWVPPENLADRAKWNSAVTCISDSNSELPMMSREYFTKLIEKPVREKMRAKLGKV